jgi:hypothetical protein
MKPTVIALALMCWWLAPAAVAQSTGFTDWSTPVNLGPVINTNLAESCPSISKNGLTLYFAAWRPAGAAVGGWDLFVSKRASVNDPWGAPVLVPNVNSEYNEMCPSLSPDEHRLFFTSWRPGCGGADLWVSRRHNRKDDFGWQPPENLGCVVNTPYHDHCSTLFEDETGTEVLYFSSERPPDTASDIYYSRMDADGVFSPALPVAELNVAGATDTCPAVRRDGLEVIFMSNRPGGLGGRDMWTATRASTRDPWSAPVNATSLNTPSSETSKSCFSFDGREFYFVSNRPGTYGYNDLWVARREKLRH